MNDTTKIFLYALGVYVTFCCAGLYLAHGEEKPPASTTEAKTQALPPGPNQAQKATTVPQHYTVPRIAKTDMPLRTHQPKPCREYLAICERSCEHRGDMFKFQCIGKEFQPFQNHFRCQCADDLYQGATQPLQVKVEQ